MPRGLAGQWLFVFGMVLREVPAPGTHRSIRLEGPALVREVRRPMSTPELLAALVPQAAKKKQGSISDSARPGPMIVRQRGLRFESKHVEAYRRVCEYRAQPKVVPPTYPEMHFTALIGEAVVSDRFPLSPLGLIHMAQRVEAHRPLRPGQAVDATTMLEDLRATGRGYELDFTMLLERDGKAVWSGLATLLSRSATTRSRKHRRSSAASPRGGGLELTVPRNTGLRYARVSGDYNPHHLWWFTARPLGYRRPIAHGMWTFGRVLSEVLRGVDEDAPLRAEAVFKRPLFMPSRVRIEAQRLTPSSREASFAVREASSGSPHLLGVASYVS